MVDAHGKVQAFKYLQHPYKSVPALCEPGGQAGSQFVVCVLHASLFNLSAKLNKFTDQIVGFGFPAQIRINAGTRPGNLNRIAFIISHVPDASVSNRLPGT